MDTKKNHARNGVCKQQDSAASVRQVPKNARRRETKGSSYPSLEGHQLRNNNNNSNQQASAYRNNNERRSKWSKTLRSSAAAAPGGEASGLTAGHLAEDLDLENDRDEEQQDDDDLLLLDQAEWDSVMVAGSKKHNLNHLLNFHYAPRDRDMQRPTGNKRDQQQQQKRNNGKNITAASSFYNKDQFLQANCQFIVKDTGDYKSHWNNPDSLVDWLNIEEVVIRSSEEPQCPICLFPPVAAKMTKCGHVYCWPCILHYLALSDKEWRKCPICYDAVRIKDLRSTVAWPYHEYQMHETVDFQLMCRRKGCLDVVKVGAELQPPDEVEEKHFPHLFDIREQQVCHSKLILANKLEITSILDRERCELQAQMETDGPQGFNCPETMFISQAMDLLQQRTNEVKNNSSSAVVQGGMEKSPFPEAATAITEGGDSLEDFYYFYQAIDGQHLYMHSINLRMLQAQYGSLASCPPVLTGRIVQREHFSVSDALRKRSKYLQHLPLTSIITVVEVGFREEDQLISPEVVQQFTEEMDQRKRDRQRKVRDEKKRERKINDIKERQMGKLLSQSAGFVREETDFYPFLTNDAVDGAAMGGPDDEALNHEMMEATASSPNTPFSFAKMLQCTSEIEKAQPQFWPTLENKKPAAAAGVWGQGGVVGEGAAGGGWPNNQKKGKASKMDKHFPNLLDTIEVEEQDNNNNNNSGSEAIAAASTSSTANLVPGQMAKSGAGPKGSAPHQQSSSKKVQPKKKQQLLLFATGMNFNRN